MTKLIVLRGASPPTVDEDIPGKVKRLYSAAYEDYTRVLLDDRVSTPSRGWVNRGVDTSDDVTVVCVSHHASDHADAFWLRTVANDSAEEQSPERRLALRNAWVHGRSSDRLVEAVRDSLRENLKELGRSFREWSSWVAGSVDVDLPARVIVTHVDSGMRVKVLKEAGHELRQAAAAFRDENEQLPFVQAVGGNWTEAKNQLRCELVDKEIDGTLTAEEVVELEQLQKEMLAYRRKLAPLPLKEVRELHQALLEKARKQNGE